MRPNLIARGRREPVTGPASSRESVALRRIEEVCHGDIGGDENVRTASRVLTNALAEAVGVLR
jgi:hypothetical protein